MNNKIKEDFTNTVSCINDALLKIISQLENPEETGDSAWKTAITTTEDLSHALRMCEPRVCKLCRCIKPHSKMPELRFNINNMNRELLELNSVQWNSVDICIECLTKLVIQ